MGASPSEPARLHFKKSRAISQVWRTSNGSLASLDKRSSTASPSPIAPSASAHSCRSIASSLVSQRIVWSAGAACASLSWPNT